MRGSYASGEAPGARWEHKAGEGTASGSHALRLKVCSTVPMAFGFVLRITVF